MNPIVRTFLRGLLAFLPFFLTVYAVYFIGAWLNRVTSQALSSVWPELGEIPGLGIAFGIAAVFALGMLVSSRLTRWIFRLIETPLKRAPVIRELYGALTQLTTFLSPKRGQHAGVVVSISHPSLDAAMIGLLMRNDVDELGFDDAGADRVAVYLPMSYQIGGFTVFVPRDWVQQIDMPVETALRETLTGWIQNDPDNTQTTGFGRRPP